MDSKTLPLFHFGNLDAKGMQKRLLESMPVRLDGLALDQPVSVDAMRHALANETAARFSDLDEVILTLFREKELDILDPSGKIRSRSLKQLRSTDRIAPPSTLLLPGLSLRR